MKVACKKRGKAKKKKKDSRKIEGENYAITNQTKEDSRPLHHSAIVSLCLCSSFRQISSIYGAFCRFVEHVYDFNYLEDKENDRQISIRPAPWILVIEDRKEERKIENACVCGCVCVRVCPVTPT